MEDENSWAVSDLIDYYRKPWSSENPTPRPPHWLVAAVETGAVAIEDDRVITPVGAMLRGERIKP